MHILEFTGEAFDPSICVHCRSS